MESRPLINLFESENRATKYNSFFLLFLLVEFSVDVFANIIYQNPISIAENRPGSDQRSEIHALLIIYNTIR